MKKIVLLLVFVFGCHLGNAQSDFREAYIVLNDGDTVNGFVDFRVGAGNSEVCKFKINDKAEVISYTPEQLTSYGFKGDKHFESREVISDSTASKRYFLELIVDGTMTLYKLKGFFYVEKNNGGLYQLNIDRREIVIDDVKVIKNYKKYKGVLSFLTADCKSSQGKVNNLGLKEKALVQFVMKYNKCIGGLNKVFKVDKPWVKATPGIGIGYNSSTIGFESAQPSAEHLISGFEKSNTALFGMDIEITSPRVIERLAFYTGLFYTKSEYIGTNSFNRSFAVVTNDVNIQVEQLRLPVGFRYTFPEKRITPFFTIGGSNTFHLNSSTRWDSNRNDRGRIMDTTQEAVIIVDNNHFGLWGGLGVKIEVFSGLAFRVETLYESTSGLSLLHSNIDSDIDNLQVIVGLVLK